MEAPLLTTEDVEDYVPVKSVKDVSSVFWKETVKLWEIAGPIAFTLICNFGINSVTIIFAGHLGELELSAVTLSVSVIGTFTFGVLLGMGSALETLCGQAYGAGQVHMLGIFMQRSLIILLVSAVILSPLYIFAAPILKLLGQANDVADLAGIFSILTIPQLFSLALYFPIQKFLQAQTKVAALAWISLGGLILQVMLLWFLVNVLRWGLTGVAMACNLSYWVLVLSQAVYVMFWCNEGWTGFSWLAFKDIWEFLKLSLASAVMLCLELWYMMTLILVVGHLNNAVLAVDSLSICMNVNGLEFMVFLGINAAISVRVSNELGLRRPIAAKYSIIVIVFQSLILGILFAVIILLTKDHFAAIFTNSKEVQRSVSHLAYLLGITMVLNSIQPVISGVAIGGGWQALVAYINLGSYYIIGLPLGILLGYKADLGVSGVWGGMIGGTALQTLLLLIVLYKTNWNTEVEQTTERMKKWGGQGIAKEKINDEI